MKCSYCGTDDQQGKICSSCAAPLPEIKKADVNRSEPFFYNGYICYWLDGRATDTIEIQFWLGRELIERIAVDRRLLEMHVPKYCDPMPFFWDLFLLAHGETDVLEWTEKNKKHPATFEVRRIENAEIERWQSLSIRDLAQEARR